MKREESRLLKDEVDSWRSFAEALRAEDREVFRKLIEKCWNYSDAIEASGKPYLVEPLLLTMLLVQHRTIEWLLAEVNRLSKEVGEYVRGLDT